MQKIRFCIFLILLSCGQAKNGADGTNGSDGRDGARGADGRDGLTGANGKDGINGRDGISPESFASRSARFETSDLCNGGSGIAIEMWQEKTLRNNQIDDEIEKASVQEQTICDGKDKVIVMEEDKPSSPTLLVPAFDIQKIAAGLSVCKAGGTSIRIYIDEEPKNKVLDKEEMVLGETILCNGEQGPSGALGGSSSSSFPAEFVHERFDLKAQDFILKTGTEVKRTETALQEATDTLVDGIANLTRKASVLRCQAKFLTNDLYFPANYNIVFSLQVNYRKNGNSTGVELPWVSQEFSQSNQFGVIEGLIALPDNWTDFNDIQNTASAEWPSLFCKVRILGPNGALLFEGFNHGAQAKVNLDD